MSTDGTERVGADRTAQWRDDLRRVLTQGCALVARGHDAYVTDEALPLALEALCLRSGEIVKRLVAAAPDRFAAPVWSLVARNRDFLAHHYDRVDVEAVWVTVERDFPRLLALLDDAQG